MTTTGACLFSAGFFQVHHRPCQRLATVKTWASLAEDGRFVRNDLELKRKELKDYFEELKEMIKADGGPPRWFTPLGSGSPLHDSPLLLYLPGIDGTGLGLIRQHQMLGKIFDIWCLHIPVKDRTSFSGIVNLVQRTIRSESNCSPSRPIYIVGESLGACIALAVASCNHDVDLALILANPATSFSKSILLPLLPLLEVISDQFHRKLHDILSLMKDSMVKGLCLQQIVGDVSQDFTAKPFYLSVLCDILPQETLIWKLQMLKTASTFANSRLDAVVAETLILSRLFEDITSPVILSTLDNGKIVRGLGGIPSEGPVLIVGYHMLFGMDLIPIISQFFIQRKMILRGMAHPLLFERLRSKGLSDSLLFDVIRLAGAVPVSAKNFYKLLSSKSHILLYPGGAREALHRKDELYKLLWPNQSQFVRMAARFGAKIVPFGTVGEDDVFEVLFDFKDPSKIPFLNSVIEDLRRTDENGEMPDEDTRVPVVLPKIPGRFYYYFGKPIETEGRTQELRDRKKAQELYLQVQAEIEKCLAFLKEKRANDPYRNILARLVYQATHGSSTSEVPTFEL